MRLQEKFHWLLLALFWTVGGLVNDSLAADRPNVLFCIADDWGWPHAGAPHDTQPPQAASDRQVSLDLGCSKGSPPPSTSSATAR